MEFPVFELSYLGSNTLIALIAIIHVLVSHGAAVGGSILVVRTEYLAFKNQDKGMDLFARKLLGVFFIVTTTIGAITGVGIWFSVTTGQPASIGSLLRVFFWGWFAEWIFFIAEIIFLVLYYYTWKSISDRNKKRHLWYGIGYVIAAWLSMFIITGVLAAMLTPGKWLETRSFWDAFINPTWLPSLFFRTFAATALASSFAMIFVQFNKKLSEVRQQLIPYLGKWLLASSLLILLTGVWYVKMIPSQGQDLIQWASGFINPRTFMYFNIAGALIITLISITAILKSSRYTAVMAVVVLLFSVFYIGEVEMVREKIRKPYIMTGYMYVNGILADEGPRMNKTGILTFAKWSPVHTVSPDNVLEAGREIYKIECSACHTVNGWNSRRDIAHITKGWSKDVLNQYIANLNSFRSFMPPFFGTDAERDALSTWISSLNNTEGQVSKHE